MKSSSIEFIRESENMHDATYLYIYTILVNYTLIKFCFKALCYWLLRIFKIEIELIYLIN